MKMKHFLAILLAVALLLAPACPALADSESETSSGEQAEYDGYIVKLRSGAVVPMSADTDAVRLGANLYQVDSAEDAYRLAGAGAVELVVPNYRVHLLDEESETETDPGQDPDPNQTPDPQQEPDYLAGAQWYLNGEHGMNIAAAWTAGAGLNGDGVTVAVLDTGLDTSHIDFSGSTILTGYNATTDGGDCDDVLGHGTAVTGVIAAGLNDMGMVGAAYQARILPIRVFDRGGNGYISYVLRGIDYAIEQKANVINMSLGVGIESIPNGDRDDVIAAFNGAADEAAAAGIIVVAAAGNDGTAELNYPAACPNVIGVGAIDSTGTLASYSQRNRSVWVTAPGSGIYTTKLGGEYGRYSGTSLACPCVSALAALALQYARERGQTLTPPQFGELLRLTALDAGDPGYDYCYGYGIVNAAQMLNGLKAKTVRYVMNGGAWPGAAPETKYVPYYNTTVQLTDSVPSRAEYFFGGWYDNSSFTGSPVTSFLSSETLNERVYYAKWIQDVTQLAAVTLTVDGTVYPAECSGGDWIVYLPYGTAAPTGTAYVGVTYAYTGSTPEIAHQVTWDGSNSRWILAVTQDTSNEKQYYLTVDNTTYHAPTAKVNGTQEGVATPPSLDGISTAAAPFTAVLTEWFADADNDVLHYTVAQAGEPVVGVSIKNGTLTYTPPVAAAGQTVEFTVTAADARFVGASVTVSVTVGALPISTPTLAAASGTYDVSTQEDMLIGFTAYDNTFESVSVDGTLLTANTDYTVYLGEQSGSTPPEAGSAGTLQYPTYVALKKEYLSQKSNGSLTVTLCFDTGRTDGDDAAAIKKNVNFTVTIINSCKNGHAWDAGTVTTPATCTEDGVMTYTCTHKCGATQTEVINALGHNFVDCVCTRCGATDHVYENCKCTKCHTEHHTWDEGTVTTAATCTENGEMTYTCTVCDAETTETILGGHVWDAGRTEVIRTCTVDGKFVWHCTRCGEEKVETSKAPGHNYVNGVCTNCGAQQPGAGGSGGSGSGSSGSGGSGGGGGSGGSSGGGSAGPAEAATKETVEELEDRTIKTVEEDDGSKTVTTTWTDGKESVVRITAEGDQTICVKTPEGSVMAEISLPADPGEGKHFDDVAEDAWYSGYVEKATAYGLFSGTSDREFSPEDNMTRGMLMTVLFNLCGKPEYGTGADIFLDAGDSWYTKAVDWGYTVGITSGTSDTEFSPGQNISREQMVAMLYRFVKLLGIESGKRANVEDFPDCGSISDYAKDAMEWAVAEGLISGRAAADGNYIAPQDNATRAEAAAILLRLVAYLNQ